MHVNILTVDFKAVADRGVFCVEKMDVYHLIVHDRVDFIQTLCDNKARRNKNGQNVLDLRERTKKAGKSRNL